MARTVQLAPGSLALVLCRQEPPERTTEAGEDEDPSGRAVFRAFCRANARCFWNARLARAASRLAFQGWFRCGVLLVHAPPASLQVLRDAWGRRTLRPPGGFRIEAVGDVFPVQMNLIAQSQFIPLAEVLCCAVSDMNAAQIVATQESLLEHLVKHYPGIAVPSQDILYTTLGTLIKERKIYHTGEGYFIVTPQTYFITSATDQENKRTLSDESHPVPTAVTYLVSMDSSAELAKENAAPISHCKSCRCFPDVHMRDVQETQTAAEGIRKAQKGLGEARSLVQNQAVSMSEKNHVCVRAKTSSCTKDREKGKKFGFSIFWRNMSRKQKPKTEHCSFSAQFPPEEWPVRDEDNLDNIPRDIEHEIIKRINPILTVDNLIKHTVLMQKYEEQKKYNSQGTSTDMQMGKHKCSSKERVQKRQSRSAKPRRQGHSHRHKGRIYTSEPQQRRIRQEKHPKLLAAQPTPRSKSPNEVVQKPLDDNPTVLNSHLIYKRRISNPFQGLPHRRSPVTKGHRSQRTSDMKPSQSGPKERTFQRSRSLDSSRIFDCETKLPYTEQCKDKQETESIYLGKSVRSVSKDLRNHLTDHTQCSILQIDSKCCSFRDSMLGYDVHGGENEVIPEVLRKRHSLFDKLGETKEAQHILPSRDLSSVDQASSPCGLVAKTMQQFQNLGLLDYPLVVDHLRQPERQNRDLEELMKKAFIWDTDTPNLEKEGLADNDRALCDNEVEGDDGACSSLYLDDDDFSENNNLHQILPGYIEYSFPNKSKWDHLGKQKMTEKSLADCKSKIHRFEPPVLNGNECHKSSELLTKPGESHKKLNLATESCGPSSGTRFSFNYEEEPSVAECVQTSVLTDGSIFDYYSTRKASPEAENLQDSAVNTGKKPATWSKNPQTQEMKKHFKQELELFTSSHTPVLSQDIQHKHSHLEGTESHSMAGDSGIDSPRTQSLASNNSVILEELKRRQNFLQNFEVTKSSQAIIPNSLLQLTPVINV